MISRSIRPLLAILLLSFLEGCTPAPEVLPLGKPVFSFDHEAITELLISQNDPALPPWTARYAQDGWLGPQQVTPRWLVRQAPDGAVLADLLADGGFIRHLLDSLKQLRKVGTTLTGDDAGFGLLPAWTRLQWSDRNRHYEILLGSRVSSGGRNARIGTERLVVNGAALDMLDMITSFQRTRLPKLFTWALDDADRVTIRWQRPRASWSTERSTGGWARAGTKGYRLFGNTAEQALEALAHLQIEKFDLPIQGFTKPEITIQWMDRDDHQLTVEVDSDLRARSSDRPNAVFQLFSGARDILSRSRYPR